MLCDASLKSCNVVERKNSRNNKLPPRKSKHLSMVKIWLLSGQLSKSWTAASWLSTLLQMFSFYENISTSIIVCALCFYPVVVRLKRTDREWYIDLDYIPVSVQINYNTLSDQSGIILLICTCLHYHYMPYFISHLLPGYFSSWKRKLLVYQFGMVHNHSGSDSIVHDQGVALQQYMKYTE